MPTQTPPDLPPLPPDLAPGAERAIAWRATLDLPLMLRLQGFRIMTFASAIGTTADAAVRARSLAEARAALAFYDAVAMALSDPRRVLAAHPECAALVEAATSAHRGALDSVATFRNMAGALVDAAEAGPAAPEAFDAAILLTLDEFKPRMDAVVAHMASANVDRRATAAASARDGRDIADDACKEIAKVSRTIRLISINASIEAARAGPAGRTFGVIAAEIRSLSEQTETASRRVSGAVAGIMTRLIER